MNNVITFMDGVACVAESDPWHLRLRNDEIEENAGAFQILPVSAWLAMPEPNRPGGVLIETETELLSIQPFCQYLTLIAIYFADFRDGRGYSLAYLLRNRLSFRGELRAVGDVLRDQLSLMRQCGFTSFALKAGKDPQSALKSLPGISVTYSTSVSAPFPLYQRVRRQ